MTIEVSNPRDASEASDALGGVRQFSCFWPETEDEAGSQIVANTALKYLQLVRETAAGATRPVL